MILNDLKFSNFGWKFLSAILGITITYGASIKTDPLEATLQGAIWGIFVGGSLAAIIFSLCDLQKYKWNAIGWIVVAVGYGYWVIFHYEGVTRMSISESIYWRVFAVALTAHILGWWFLGALLSMKLDNRV